MNTNHLRLFSEVARAGNLTQVAHRNHVSQPAVSMQLKRLEEEFDVPLLTILGRNIATTDAGQTFLEFAETILSLEGQLQRAMEEFRVGRRGRIVVGASPAVATYMLGAVFQTFSEAHPGIKTSLETSSNGDVEKRVRDGFLDVGLTLDMPSEHLSLRVTRFTDDQWIGIRAHSQHRPARLLLPMGAVVPNVLELGLEVLRVDSIETVKRFVHEGLGVGVVLRSSVLWELESGRLSRWDEYDCHPVTVNVVTRPAERLSHSLWTFVNHLRFM